MTAQQLELRAQRLRERELAEKERSNLIGESFREQELFNQANTQPGRGVIPAVANLISTPFKNAVHGIQERKRTNVNKSYDQYNKAKEGK